MHMAYLFFRYLSVLYYLCQGGSVFAAVCLSLYVCSSVSKITRKDFNEISSKC